VFAEQDVAVDLGHLEDRMPQRLAGNRPAMRAVAADGRLPLDDGH